MACIDIDIDIIDLTGFANSNNESTACIRRFRYPPPGHCVEGPIAMLTWIRRWVYAIALLVAFAIAAWWFVQQTSSYARLEALIRQHPVVASEVGKVSSIDLPLFGYGLDVADGRVDLDFSVRVSGSKGTGGVHADFADGSITDAYLLTDEGQAIPLLIQH